MAFTIGIVLFDNAEELDWAGPWEVFGAASQMNHEDKVITIAEHDGPVRCAKGLRVLPDYTFANAPKIDIVLVPGGQGTRAEVKNAVMIDWLKRVGADCAWVTSVCTGALLLHEAGFAKGKRVTTYWGFVDQLRARGDVTVIDDKRYVQDGNLVTAAGVSAGIDMALWLIGQLHDEEFARRVQQYMEYFPEPPYGKN
ncbi:MAG: DJ-1/PfpI family protein [Candidatus Hydrogenedentes bacterium]|nr:DJ-1/PfpI family protein [Candidatus Hydrogenedentota bacterium]